MTVQEIAAAIRQVSCYRLSNQTLTVTDARCKLRLTEKAHYGAIDAYHI